MVVTLGFSEYLELDFENFKQKWDMVAQALNHNTWEAEFKVTQGYTVRPGIKKKIVSQENGCKYNLH